MIDVIIISKNKKKHNLKRNSNSQVCMKVLSFEILPLLATRMKIMDPHVFRGPLLYSENQKICLLCLFCGFSLDLFFAYTTCCQCCPLNHESHKLTDDKVVFRF